MSVNKNIELSFHNPTNRLTFVMDNAQNLTIQYVHTQEDRTENRSDLFILNTQELDVLEDFLDKARDFMVNS